MSLSNSMLTPVLEVTSWLRRSLAHVAKQNAAFGWEVPDGGVKLHEHCVSLLGHTEDV
jgi:hypothetical protein